MLRAVWFIIKVAVLVAIAVWVADQPGTVDITWHDYRLQATTGTVLLTLLVALLVILVVYKCLLWVWRRPQAYRHYKELRGRDKGVRALTLGLAAVAAGDARIASYQASRARKYLPSDKGLSLLLEAQAARLQGDEKKAEAAFTKLSQNKDAAFLGMRGLLVKALDRGDRNQALALAQKAAGSYGSQPWLSRLTYDLALSARNWDTALKLLKQAEKQNIFEADKIRSDRVAILIAEADEAEMTGAHKQAGKKLKEALKLKPGFVPAATRLAALYLHEGKRRKAVGLIEKAWKENPHPDLAALWHELVPQKKTDEAGHMLSWHEKLVSFNPHSAQGQMAAARAAIREGFRGKARSYLKMAESIEPSAPLYKLWAEMEEQQGDSEQARYLLKKAADAPPEKVWTCRETGRIYERWMPVAEPHGSFNTIIWDYPHPLHEQEQKVRYIPRDALLSEL